MVFPGLITPRTSLPIIHCMIFRLRLPLFSAWYIKLNRKKPAFTAKYSLPAILHIILTYICKTSNRLAELPAYNISYSLREKWTVTETKQGWRSWISTYIRSWTRTRILFKKTCTTIKSSTSSFLYIHKLFIFLKLTSIEKDIIINSKL